MKRISTDNWSLATKNNFKSTKLKVVSLCSFGHLLELYDYTLFAVMISIISTKFFPAENPNVSIVLGFLSFAVSFIFAALGSIFWGWYGDKFGRRKMLNFSMLIMSIPSLIISILPTYDQIGIFAPLILIMARILQGISASGEIKGAKIYAMEISDNSQLGFISGLLTAAGGIGVLFAMLMGYLVSISDYEHAWRIPFLIGSIIGYVGLKIKKTHHDTNPPIVEEKNIQKKILITDLPKIIKSYKMESACVFSLGAVLGILSYTLHAFMNPFLISQGFNTTDVYALGILALLSTASSSILAGLYHDYFKKPFNIMQTNLISMIMLIIPSFMLIENNLPYLNYLAFIILGALLGVNATICSIVMFKSFPYEVRCRGVMFLYALSVSIFGGFTPLTLNFLAKYDFDLPGIAITFMLLIFLSLYSFSSQKMVKKDATLS
ncbi:MAG: MFS transporter [Sphingobacteriia bacterium]|nr:MFS transporter [Sphingobacteriia bacterium]